jgi:hypothetical protein
MHRRKYINTQQNGKEWCDLTSHWIFEILRVTLSIIVGY